MVPIEITSKIAELEAQLEATPMVDPTAVGDGTHPWITTALALENYRQVAYDLSR